jgi:putative transposase
MVIRSDLRSARTPRELLDRGARVVIESGRPIAHVARDLGVPAETLRRWVRTTSAPPGSARRAREDERLLDCIEQLHAANYHAYGYRRTWKALRREGISVGRDRVRRLMRQHGIQGAKRRGRPWRTTTPDPAARRPPDLAQRDFSASRRDELWVADFTYLRCWEGLVFFSFVIDAFSRRVVGWQFATHMRTDLVLDALRMALSRRPPGADVELVHHSDAGSQYTSYAFTQTLDDHGVLASIGSVGDAYDNALAESFADSFKTELIADRVWRTRSQLELAIVEYIGWFNHDRLHEALGDIPPAEFEQTALSRTAVPDSPASPASRPAIIRKPTNPVSAKPSPAHRAGCHPHG